MKLEADVHSKEQKLTEAKDVFDDVKQLSRHQTADYDVRKAQTRYEAYLTRERHSFAAMSRVRGWRY